MTTLFAVSYAVKFQISHWTHEQGPFPWVREFLPVRNGKWKRKTAGTCLRCLQHGWDSSLVAKTGAGLEPTWINR